MKKVVIALVATMLGCGVVGAIIQKPEPEKKDAVVKPSRSGTAFLKVVAKKYKKTFLPKKVSGKVRRDMNKALAQKPMAPQNRLLAFVMAQRKKSPVPRAVTKKNVDSKKATKPTKAA